MGTSFFARFRRLHRQIRCWRYQNNRDEITALEIVDFIDYANEFSHESGLRPLLITPDGVFVRTVPGFFMWFDPRASASKLWGVEKTGLWEPAAVRICLERISKGGVFLDIGANLGYYAMSVAMAADKAVVHAFEPVGDIFRGLTLGVRASGLADKIVMNNLAVADHCGTIPMVVNGQQSHMVSGENIEILPVATVPATTVDAYCEEQHLSGVRLVKCDVEGLELRVLQGARQVLCSQKPSLVIEIEDRWTIRYGYKGADVFAFLEQYGYSSRPILKDGSLGRKEGTIEEKLKQSWMFLFEIETSLQ